VNFKVVNSGGGTLKVGETMTYTRGFKPTCPTGPCAVVVSGVFGGHPFTATLTRAGALYIGTARAHIMHWKSFKKEQATHVRHRWLAQSGANNSSMKPRTGGV
jgi:hypothetical protein